MIDSPLVHGLQQGPHAIAFLEEVHVVQVGVAVAIVPRLALADDEQDEDSEAGTDDGQGLFSRTVTGRVDRKAPWRVQRAAANSCGNTGNRPASITLYRPSKP
ncbi:hypothetical protein D9M73_248950 [compost metagenome]